MTAGNEEHEPLITSSVDNQRVAYSNTPPVSTVSKLSSFIQKNVNQKNKIYVSYRKNNNIVATKIAKANMYILDGFHLFYIIMYYLSAIADH